MRTAALQEKGASNRPGAGHSLGGIVQTVAVAALAAVLLLAGASTARAEDHGAAVFECVPCGMKFADRKAWARHEIRVHGADGCEECGVLFHNRLERAAHEILHHHATHCSACGRSFRSNRAAVEHLVTIHYLPRCGYHHLVFADEGEAAAHAARCPAFRAAFERWKAEARAASGGAHTGTASGAGHERVSATAR